MDTETVLKTIAMLNHRIQMFENITSSMPNSPYHMGILKAYSDFREHLQSYIESQVNQVENEMNRGE
jgi:hypothetical protein